MVTYDAATVRAIRDEVRTRRMDAEAATDRFGQHPFYAGRASALRALETLLTVMLEEAKSPS
jgi:hypothetical protein